ncbi:hypothetical protein HK097_007579 [Rhizophlyctis rosea]|uniref:Uncharacterized protein n=1 Tax=Rhizophlyctis rosea TaxID=64517 RepID=A0AAD5SLN2_9FUNG|nr:hypothetical protein HK097_007579 [Rhizophlyctis rosea]
MNYAMPSIVRAPSVGPATSPIAFMHPTPLPKWATQEPTRNRVELDITNPPSEDRNIFMPAPRKPVVAGTASHMVIPRLDASTPARFSQTAAGGAEEMDAGECLRRAVFSSAGKLGGVTKGAGKLGSAVAASRPVGVNVWSDLAPSTEPLTPVNENMEKGEEEDGFGSDYSEDDAYAELLEIVTKPKAHVLVNFNSPAIPRDAPPKGHRRRKSSVPSVFFGMESHMERFAAMHGPSVGVEPPRLAKTPFRPKEGEMLAPPVADLRLMGSSPVSRAKNPVPFNSPFFNQLQNAMHSRPESPHVSYNSHQSGVELGLLSPSPSPDLILVRPSLTRVRA